MTKYRGYMVEKRMDSVISKVKYPNKVFGYFQDGKLYIGFCSKHRTLTACMWRTIIRLKKNYHD